MAGLQAASQMRPPTRPPAHPTSRSRPRTVGPMPFTAFWSGSTATIMRKQAKLIAAPEAARRGCRWGGGQLSWIRKTTAQKKRLM